MGVKCGSLGQFVGLKVLCAFFMHLYARVLVGMSAISVKETQCLPHLSFSLK